MLSDNKVGIYYADTHAYPGQNETYWFRPGCLYPEFHNFYAKSVSHKNNLVYEAVRELLHLYRMDEKSYGTFQWNPLGEIIRPGDYVLLKPNLVMHCNRSGGGTDCLVTQPAVLAPVLDYVILALKGRGHITIGDAPMQECRFRKLLKESGYLQMLSYYKSILKQSAITISVVDFRGLTTEMAGRGSRRQTIRKGVKGTVVDLGSDSAFAGCSAGQLRRMRITNYDPNRLKSHHDTGRHEYEISDELLHADVVINLPKPKSHRKAGFTAAMKNMVGINVRKEYLPHHTIAGDGQLGDASKKNNWLRRLDDCLYDKKNTLEGSEKYRQAIVLWYLAGILKVLANRLCRDEPEGNWYGNRTISKTIADLNKILLYADKKGVMRTERQRRVLTIADLIVAGQKEGPVAPSPKPLGVLAIAQNSFAFDMACGFMMGADISRIPQMQDALLGNEKYPVLPKGIRLPAHVPDDPKWLLRVIEKMKKEVKIVSNCGNVDGLATDEVTGGMRWNIEPSRGWREVFFGYERK